MRALNLHSPRDDTSAMRRWTATRRALDHEQANRDLLAELRRLRGEVLALRVTLEGRAR